jgi:hypothetical protein
MAVDEDLECLRKISTVSSQSAASYRRKRPATDVPGGHTGILPDAPQFEFRPGLHGVRAQQPVTDRGQ